MSRRIRNAGPVLGLALGFMLWLLALVTPRASVATPYRSAVLGNLTFARAPSDNGLTGGNWVNYLLNGSGAAPTRSLRCLSLEPHFRPWAVTPLSCV